MSQSKSYSVILEGTSHPGNIGAAARAMKTMGISDLRLVNCVNHKQADAWARASGADDLLDHAQSYTTIENATHHLDLLLGMSGRPRTERNTQPIVATELHTLLDQYPTHKRIGLLFGNEKNGLDNSALALCHHQVIIPTSKNFKSLNLAASVQIISYLCHTYQQKSTPPEPLSDIPASMENILTLAHKIQHIMHTLDTKKLYKTHLEEIQQILLRRHPTKKECDILQGILKNIIKHISPSL